MKFTIEIANTIVVTSRGAEVSVDVSKLTPEIVALLVEHGLGQKVGDAASGAKKILEVTGGDDIVGVTQQLMEKAADGLYAGEWTRRREGAGAVDERTSVARSIARKVAKAKFGAKSPEWAKFTGLDAGAQNAKLDEWVGVMGSAIDADVDAEVKRRKDAEKAKGSLAKKMDFAI